jgi:purine-binding chemotaxis protein CheW
MTNFSKLLVFHIDDQRFALPINVVRKVTQVVEFTPLPKMPKYIHGVISYHGDILPVINLSYLFNISTKELDINDRLIIASSSNGKLALLATLVHDVIDIEPNEIVEPDKIIYGTSFLHGAIKHPEGMILINDIDKFLSKKELALLEEGIEKEKNKIESHSS